MNWLALAGVITLASAGGAAVGEAEIVGSAPAAAGTETLVLEADRYRRMTVPVTVNGQGPFRFMIDTGAQATVLSHTLADSLQLGARQSATLVAMASTREVQTAMIGELSFGSHSAFDARAALVAGENIGGADGILGLDTLQDRRVMLDFQNERMEVDLAGSRADNRGYDIVVRARHRHGQLIIATAQIDGVRTAVMVDTGAQGSVGNAALQRRLRRAHAGLSSEMTDINGVQTTGEVRFARKLDFGRAQINNLMITFTESPTFAALELTDQPALILGMNELRLFERVAIDFPNRRVLFDMPEGSTLRDFDTFSRIAG